MAPPDPRDLIPHRDPFLFVDEVVELDPGTTARTRWTPPADMDVFRGHFPGRPILPGVLIVEAIAQAGAIAGMALPVNAGGLALFAGIEKVRFRRPVLPGDTLDIRTTITRTRGRVGWADGTAHVGDALACQASISFAFVEEGQAP